MALPTLPTPGVTSSWGNPLNAYLDALKAEFAEPAGIVKAFAGSSTSVPVGHVLCDGRALPRTGVYANLFAVIGTQYGVGDNSTTFNIPNLMGRVPVGKDSSGEFGTLGQASGSKYVQLQVSEMPAHGHTINHTHDTAWTNFDGIHTHNVEMSTTANGNGARLAGGNNTTSMIGSGPVNYDGQHQHFVNVPGFNGWSDGAGGNGSHYNIQPYIVLNFVITY